MTLMSQYFKMLHAAPFNMSFENLERQKSRAAPVLSNFQKCPLTPIIPHSTCPLQCECLRVSSLLTHPLSWVICCVNTVYLQLTGPFGCGAGNAITGSKHLHCYHWRVRRSFRSPLQRGPLLIGISFEDGITNEAIWKPFMLSKELAHVCGFAKCACVSVHVCVCACLLMDVCMRGRDNVFL